MNEQYPRKAMTNLDKVALIFGVSGIIGRNLSEFLLSEGSWKVVGVSRHRPEGLAGVEHVAANLSDPAGCRQAISNAAPSTHVFFAAWSRQSNEPENCRVNGAMFRNAIEAAVAGGAVRHVALVTGLKYYMGSSDHYATHALDTPFTEDQPRLPMENFYYEQEDILLEAAQRCGFTWSVARPHTVIGYAPGSAMNLGTSLAVYATLCRETRRPFQFPGSPQQYRGLVDVTAAEILARHLAWQSTTREGANTAFNVVNGDVFRWEKMWQRIADYFEIAAAPYSGEPVFLAASLSDAEHDWERIVRRHGLKPHTLEQIASWWFVDANLGRTQECITDMSLSRERGFLAYQRSWPAFKILFDRLRAERVIPR
jgi:nucleoside-diphosphate-sugar epimerase